MIRFYLKTLLLPPAINLLMLLLAGWLWRRHAWLAGTLAVISTCSLLVLSMPGTAQYLQQQYAFYPAISPQDARSFHAGALVVLGGGRSHQAAEYGRNDQVSMHSLRRLHYAAWLQREIDLPILVSGGRFPGDELSEAELMRDTLDSSYSATVSWIEPSSRNTWENAAFSAAILKSEDVQRVVLVTTAYHMPRAVSLFEQQGLQVLPAPTGFYTPVVRGQIARWLPTADGLLASVLLLHEMLGVSWYRLREQFPGLGLPA